MEMEATGRNTKSMSNQEKYMSENPDLLDGTFLDGASVVKKAVGKILIGGNRVAGTGFRISKNLIMTCQHLGNISQNDAIHFNYVDLPLPDTPAIRSKSATETFTLRPDILFYESPALDFAVVAISDANENLRSPENMETISSVRLVKERKQLTDLQVSILSYPEGKPLKASLRKRTVVEDSSKVLVVGNERLPVTEEVILHTADTEVGSSGAPIFDECWRLVGIHQGLANELVSQADGSTKEVFYSNYGTLLKPILDEMLSKPGEELTEFEKKFNACQQDLGIPFKEHSTKLKDISGPALPVSSVPPPAIAHQPPDQVAVVGANLSSHTNEGSTETSSLPRQKHVLLLAESWGWLKKNELSFITTRMAMEFAKCGPEVRVSCLVAQTSPEEQAQARENGVHLYAIKRLRNSAFMPPADLSDGPKVDIIIGCGQAGGEHGEFVKTQFCGSNWVHIACSYPDYEDENEVQFCESADRAFAIGDNLASEYENRLAFSRKTVRGFTPGLLKDSRMYEQSQQEPKVFKVLIFYPSTRELQSGDQDIFNIPAKAIGTLSERQYRVLAVCDPHSNPNDLKTFLLQNGSSQMIVRSGGSIEARFRMFIEADLLIMPFLPSKSESFGLIGLQAFSAGLPVLLNQECGLARTLYESVPHGNSYVVNSGRPEEWRGRIQDMKEKPRSLRLSEVQTLLQSYDEHYSWERQSREALDEILQLP